MIGCRVEALTAARGYPSA